MSSPVELTDLPIWSTALSPSDIMLVRVGLTDYQVAVSIVQSILINSLSPIAGGSAQNTDKFIINRAGQNYNIAFSQVGFVKGTRMWFYSGTAPTGWQIVPSTGDRLLAVSDGTNNYSGAAGGTQGGTWQQEGYSLQLTQIPKHRHAIVFTKDPSGTSSTAGPVRGKNRDEAPGAQGETQDQGGTPTGTDPHNHGNTWRPLANVGLICEKNS